MKEEVLCVSGSLAVAEGPLCWEGPCPAASVQEKLHLLEAGRRTHDLKGIKDDGHIHVTIKIHRIKIKIIVESRHNENSDTAMILQYSFYWHKMQSYLGVWGPVAHATETGPKTLWWRGWWTVVASEPVD